MSPPRVRLQTPGTPDPAREQWRDEAITFPPRPNDGVLPADHPASLGFDLLFDTIDDQTPNESGPMPMLLEEDSGTSSSDDGHDVHAVYVRRLRNLTKHATDAEADTYKRLAAACAAVGPGEVGDFAHADALRAAFNDVDITDVTDETATKPAKKSWKKSSSSEKSGGFTPPPSSSSSSDAFVATTPGAAGHAALLNLRHSFLWVKTEPAATIDEDAASADADDASPQRPRASATATPMKRDVATETGVMVMEPYLRAHFVISRPTERYQRLLDTLPPHFVGPHERLARLVDFMSEQMLASFKERGMPVPPWRQNKSILSKWFLPTAKSLSQPPTPSGSPPMSSNGSKGRSTSRRASVNFDVVGGRGVFFGIGYGTQEPYESSRGVEKVAMGSLSSSMRLLRDAMIA